MGESNGRQRNRENGDTTTETTDRLTKYPDDSRSNENTRAYAEQENGSTDPEEVERGHRRYHHTPVSAHPAPPLQDPIILSVLTLSLPQEAMSPGFCPLRSPKWKSLLLHLHNEQRTRVTFTPSSSDLLGKRPSWYRVSQFPHPPPRPSPRIHGANGVSLLPRWEGRADLPAALALVPSLQGVGKKRVPVLF